jgi:hypothetical protein
MAKFKKELTQEQKEIRNQRKGLFTKISKLSDEEKLELMDKVGVLTTCEGHTLTLNNTLFVYAQLEFSEKKLIPTIIGGFNQWLDQGRSVRKGEKALFYILVPCNTKKDKEGAENDPTSIYFIERPMFDISQTDEIAC